MRINIIWIEDIYFNYMKIVLVPRDRKSTKLLCKKKKLPPYKIAELQHPSLRSGCFRDLRRDPVLWCEEDEGRRQDSRLGVDELRGLDGLVRALLGGAHEAVHVHDAWLRNPFPVKAGEKSLRMCLNLL